jgi:hypothetical protein
MGGKEDVRRFDAGIVLSSTQVDSAIINKLLKDRPICQHTYTSDLCNRLIIWAWTRKPDQVVFDADATQACLTEANKLSERFSDELPLIDKGTTKHKLARLAAALAARLFNVDEDLKTLRVTKAHVEFVAQQLDEWYSDKIFGYLAYSEAQDYKLHIKDAGLIRKHLFATKFPRDFVDGLLNRNEILPQDIQDWTHQDREGAQSTLSFLVRKHALNRDKRWYVKSAEFITLLKEIDAAPQTAQVSDTERF